MSRRRPYSVDEEQLQVVVLQRTEMYKNFCYTFQLKYVFRLEENMSRVVGSANKTHCFPWGQSLSAQ